jgi:hypothetical protein
VVPSPAEPDGSYLGAGHAALQDAANEEAARWVESGRGRTVMERGLVEHLKEVGRFSIMGPVVMSAFV